MEQIRTCRSKTNSFLKKRLAFLPARLSLGIIAWVAFINIYMVRVNMSVAIIAMVKRNITGGKHAICFDPTEGATSAPLSSVNNSTSSKWPTVDDHPLTTTPSLQQQRNNEEGDFMWDETAQGLILGSFYYGYTLSQIIGGRMAEVYGTRLVFGLSILSGGLSAVLTPLASNLHFWALITLRAIQGFFQGVTWPSMHACISRWIPPIERPRFVALVYLANTLSPALTLPLCALVIADYGWATMFYMSGCLSLFWTVIWFAFTYDTPEEHPRISEEELNFLQTVLKESGTRTSVPKKVPWKEILKSPPFWAINMFDLGNSWGVSVIFSLLPTYMNNVLGFSMKSNGFVSAAPFLGRYIGGIISSTLGAWFISHGKMSVRGTRRFFGVIALLGPALMTLGVSFAGCNAQLIVILFCLTLLFNGAVTTSGFVNHTDISPNFAGTLMGITNTTGSLISFIVPVVNGVILTEQQNMEAWQKVFWICVPVYLLGLVIFVIFVSGEVQPWNDVDSASVTSLTSVVGRQTPDVFEDAEKEPLNALPKE